MKPAIISWMAEITFVLTIILMGMVGYWELWPDNIVTIEKSVTTDKAVYYAGERITYTISYCKTRKLPGEVLRSLVNGTRITFSTIESDLPIGCHTMKVSDLIIPDYVDSGIYHIEGTGQYQINPLRKYYNFWESQEFEIINLDRK
jgi:hypothetical protein